LNKDESDESKERINIQEASDIEDTSEGSDVSKQNDAIRGHCSPIPV